MIRAILLSTTILCSFSLHAQKEVSIVFDQDEVVKQYTISTLRLYLSNIQIKTEDGVWIADPAKAHLIDLEHPESWAISLPNCNTDVSIDSISFLIGIDSLTNVAGVLDGDLDPIKGMYWSWNSGYINFKVEGKEIASGTSFEYHLGGYLPPFSTAREVRLKSRANGNQLRLKLNLAHFLDQIDRTEQLEVMIPGPEAMQLSDNLSTCFSID